LPIFAADRDILHFFTVAARDNLTPVYFRLIHRSGMAWKAALSLANYVLTLAASSCGSRRAVG
jgi:hypothetical protein